MKKLLLFIKEIVLELFSIFLMVVTVATVSIFIAIAIQLIWERF